MSGQIGDDIRALRKARGLTLKDMAAALGRSIGWLSQIERGQSTPSVKDLGLLAEQLGVRISLFFRSASQNPAERGLILRATDRVRIGSSESGLTEELLSPTLTGAFEIIQSTFAPRSDSGGFRASRESCDGGVVISGHLTLTIGELTTDLGPGDSFQFNGTKYAWQNDGDEPAVVIWVISPPIY